MAQMIKDIMTSSPKTCELNHPITCTLNIMQTESVGAVPVLDQNKKLVGIVTDRDIALCLLENNKLPGDIKVSNCAHTGQMITARPDDSLQQALKLMEKNQIRRLPVVDQQGNCIGIVSQADIALQDRNPEDTVEFVKEVSKHKQSIGAH